MNILDLDLSGVDNHVPYALVADESFPLAQRILQPFKERELTENKTIFNYRLCRARRVVENAFGKWSITYFIKHYSIIFGSRRKDNIDMLCFT